MWCIIVLRWKLIDIMKINFNDCFGKCRDIDYLLKCLECRF